MIRLGWRRRTPSTPDRAPLLYFVHVPKTAGSTLNAYLAAWSANGFDHCESVIERPDEWTRRFRRADWMSGHTMLDTVLARAAHVPDRRMRLFTCMREPTAQMMSHYNWLIEIHRRGGNFYEQHPPKAKEISEFIRASDHSPEAVQAALRRYPGVFCNVQARVVLGDRTWTRPEMIERLGGYEAAVPHEQVSAMFQTMTGRQPPTTLRTNRSEYHFDPAVFGDPGLLRFLREYNAQDYELWDLVTHAGNRAGAASQPGQHHRRPDEAP